MRKNLEREFLGRHGGEKEKRRSLRFGGRQGVKDMVGIGERGCSGRGEKCQSGKHWLEEGISGSTELARFT